MNFASAAAWSEGVLEQQSIRNDPFGQVYIYLKFTRKPLEILCTTQNHIKAGSKHVMVGCSKHSSITE